MPGAVILLFLGSEGEWALHHAWDMVNDKRTGEAVWCRVAGGSGQADRVRSPRHPTHGGSFAFRKKGTKYRAARKRGGTRSACSFRVRPLWIPRIAIVGGMSFSSRKVPCGRAGTLNAEWVRGCGFVLPPCCAADNADTAPGAELHSRVPCGIVRVNAPGSGECRNHARARPRNVAQQGYRDRSTRSLGESL